MGWIKRLLFVFFTGIFLSCQVSFAQDLKIFFGPSCDDNDKVHCKNSDETVVCIRRDPISVVDEFQPFCNHSQPSCIDANETVAKDVIPDCIRIPVCEDGSIVCPHGTEPSCLGGGTPDCGIEGLCKEGVAVCDYPSDWQASASQNSYR